MFIAPTEPNYFLNLLAITLNISLELTSSYYVDGNAENSVSFDITKAR